MGIQKNKSKRKDASKTRKSDNSQTKCDGKKSSGNGDNKPINNAETENSLNTLFRSDEIQELKRILKVKDLSTLPLLLGAVILGKFDVVKKLIKQGYNVNQLFDNTTPLMWAVKTKNKEMIDLLVSRNADISPSDNNGDNILFLAINCSLWDENSFMDFWNKLGKSHDININYTNKNNFTMLHFAVKRQWKLLVDILIEEKVKVDVSNSKGVTPLTMAAARNDLNIVKILMRAGANVLHEDQRGCTPICFVIGNIIQKKWKPPYDTLEELTKDFKSSGDLSYENYLQRRLELIITPPNNNITAHQHVINKIIIAIIRFIMTNLPSGVEMLLKLNIFFRLKQAMEKHINYSEYLFAILSVIAIVLRWCKCCVGVMCNNVHNCEIEDAFINSGTADACISCLVHHNDSPCLKQLLPQGLLPIFIACGGESLLARQWLETHLKQLEPFYQKFLDICLVNFNIKEDETHVLLVKQKLKSFKLLYEELKCEENKETLAQKAKTKSNLTLLNAPKQNEIINPGKKQAKRVRRKNRARIAKMRSADVAERRRINSSVRFLNPDLAEDSSVTIIQDLIDKEIEIINENDDQNAKISVFESNDIENTNVDLENNESKEIIEIIVNNPIKSVSSECIEVLQEEIYNVLNRNDIYTDSYQNLSIQNSSSSYKSADSGILVNVDILENDINMYLDNNTIANRRASFSALITRLRIMLNDIIAEYEEHWHNDRITNHPGYVGGNGDNVQAHPLLQGCREEQIHYLNGLLPHIEQQKISHLIEAFDKVAKKIEDLYYSNDITYKNLVSKLRLLLTNHNVRGKQNFFECNGEKDEPFYTEEPRNNCGIIGEHLPRPIGPTYMELIENVLPEQHNIRCNNQDELYLKELLSIPQYNSNLTKIEIEEIRKRTEDHAYHLINSASKICESETCININYGNSYELFPVPIIKEKSVDGIIHLEENKSLVILSKKQSDMVVEEIPICSKSSPDVSNKQSLDIPRISRWSTTIKSLQNFLRRKLQTKGANKQVCYLNVGSNEEQVLACPIEARSHYIIASGGSFGDVELAFDRTGSAIALKRIQCKQLNVCRMVMVYVTPLLTIQHKHLLSYISCDRDNEGNVYLTTPLCEYNLGEYLMYLKFDQGRQQAICQKIETSYLIIQMLNGLRYLHELDKPIIHGNLKPSNVLIDIHGRLRLAEFGIFRTLYQNAKAPKSSLIWFARETYENYEQYLSMDCSKASDIQVTGMLTHFILTRGLHPFGIVADDILHNLIQGTPILQTCECEISDLISWMLLYEASERPTVRQVLMHIYFWDENKKWSFLLACTGITHFGVPIPDFPLEKFYTEFDAYAKSNQIEGEWMPMIKKQFPDINLPLPEGETSGKDTPTSLLKFMRKCVEQKIFQDDMELKKFILRAFPALPLLLFVHVESSEWLLHPVFMRFLDVCK